ncbi:unnamed protein product, partial [Ectocarpus sp. 12 AP-2014]
WAGTAFGGGIRHRRSRYTTQPNTKTLTVNAFYTRFVPRTGSNPSGPLTPESPFIYRPASGKGSCPGDHYNTPTDPLGLATSREYIFYSIKADHLTTCTVNVNTRTQGPPLKRE